MGKIIFALIFMAALASPLRAQKAGDMGVGVVLGNPTAVTGKVWLDPSQAVDAGLGFSTHFAAYGDYLLHGWDVLPHPSRGRLPVYVGLGAQVRTFHETEIGIRAVAGAAYWLPRDPVEIFLEIVPVLRLEPHGSVGLDAGLGLRYYFRS